MIAYTFWDFLLQSVLIVFIGLLFWGMVAFLVLLAIIGIDTLREQLTAPKSCSLPTGTNRATWRMHD